MTTDANVPAVSLARMVARLLCAAGVLVTVDLAFWLAADGDGVQEMPTPSARLGAHPR